MSNKILSHHGIFITDTMVRNSPLAGLYFVKTNKKGIPGSLHFFIAHYPFYSSVQRNFLYLLKLKSVVGPIHRPSIYNKPLRKSLKTSKIKSILVLMSDRKNYKKIVLIIFELPTCL